MVNDDGYLHAHSSIKSQDPDRFSPSSSFILFLFSFFFLLFCQLHPSIIHQIMHHHEINIIYSTYMPSPISLPLPLMHHHFYFTCMWNAVLVYGYLLVRKPSSIPLVEWTPLPPNFTYPVGQTAEITWSLSGSFVGQTAEISVEGDNSLSG